MDAKINIAYHHEPGQTPLLGVPIGDFLRDVGRRFPDHEAIVSIAQKRRMTYRDLIDSAEDLARGLMGVGVRQGDRIGIWAVDNIEWVQLQIAAAMIGAVLVNVNPANKKAELEHVLRCGRIQHLFFMPAFRKSHYAEMIREICPEVETSLPESFQCAAFPDLKTLVMYDPDNPHATVRPARGCMVWQELLEKGHSILPDTLEVHGRSLHVDDPINMQFTSGTTGFPKPVMLTHHNILNNAYFTAETLGIDASDRLCVPVPFYHCFGMVVSTLVCLTHGATLVIPAPHFDPDVTLRTIEQERCTVLHGVPTMFVAELEALDQHAYDLSSLRTGIMAGAPCPPELLRRVIEDLGCRDIRIGYGQTEASPITHMTRSGDTFERRITSVGRGLPFQETRIINPDTGKTLTCGETGEVCFRGYHVMRGYFEQEEATREAIDEAGWLRSGDLGTMDEEGYVQITGRLKDMIIRGGENIYPAEIEAYLDTHPAVAQAAVFGIPDEEYGEEIGAWVQLHENADADAETLRAYVRQGMAHYKTPRYLKIVNSFPMTVTGKIQKFRMREQSLAASY